MTELWKEFERILKSSRPDQKKLYSLLTEIRTANKEKFKEAFELLSEEFDEQFVINILKSGQPEINKTQRAITQISQRQ